MLRDRFVCGLSNEATQKRLLTEQNLDLAKALGVAQAMEAAQKNALQFKDLSVGRVKLDQKGSQVAEKQVTPCRNACYRCGKNNHVANKCKFIDATCHCCGKTGHIASVCRRKQKNERRGGCKLRWVENQSQTETEELKVMKIEPERSAPSPVLPQARCRWYVTSRWYTCISKGHCN